MIDKSIRYTDEQIDDFLALAREIGLGRAMKELKYPAGYITAQRWAVNRGVDVYVDPIAARAKQFDKAYKEEDMLAVVKQGVLRVYAELVENYSLSPDDHKKLSEAFQKYNNAWLLLQGKANAISESHNKDSIDVELADLIAAERARTHLEKQTDNVKDNEASVSV